MNPIHIDDLELLDRLARGWTAAQVADDLGLPPAAVRLRVRRIRTALGARTTVHAVVIAVRAGLLPPSPGLSRRV